MGEEKIIPFDHLKPFRISGPVFSDLNTKIYVSLLAATAGVSEPACFGAAPAPAPEDTSFFAHFLKC